MNLTIEKSSDYKTILVKSDSNTVNTDYPVMEVYLNNVLQYVLVVGGTATVDGIDYATTSNATNLNFETTTTTKGTEYIHTINPTTLGLTTNTLPSGVWSFKLLDSTAVLNLFIGIVIHEDIDCCLMNLLDDICNENCSIDKLINTSQKIESLLYSANISAKLGEFTNAKCKYEIAKNLCSECT